MSAPIRLQRPIALTCGDPAGIGPEIAVKARLCLGRDVPLLWIGDPRICRGNGLRGQ